jgi:hypothetical protein
MAYPSELGLVQAAQPSEERHARPLFPNLATPSKPVIPPDRAIGIRTIQVASVAKRWGLTALAAAPSGSITASRLRAPRELARTTIRDNVLGADFSIDGDVIPTW